MSNENSAAATRVRDALRDAGAPVPTPKDMERLYQGRMSDVLDFATSNLVGRNAAASARNTVQMYRETSRSMSASSREEIDPLYVRVQRAEARVKTAQAALQQSEEQMKKPTGILRSLESESEASQKDLEHKRITMLLLSVLERKEGIRKQRFHEILRLLSELRSNGGEEDARKRVENQAPTPSSSATARSLRVEHTRDTLASLQSHGIRLARLASAASEKALPTRAKDAEARLLTAIARSLGSTSDSPEAIAAYEKALTAARSRARETIEYRSPLPPDDPGDDLEDASHRIAEKERELQELADHTAALTLACARALQADTVFTRETVPQLESALREEAASTQGYVDTLRLSIANRPGAPSGAPVGSLGNGRSFERVLSDIEGQYTDARDTESFLCQASTLITPDPAASGSHAALAASYAEEERALSARLQKLLERKAAKADAGRVLVEDIERLVAEVGIIAGAHV